MRKPTLFFSALFLCALIASCAQLSGANGGNVVILNEVHGSCRSLGELSSNVGSVTTQLNNLKNLAAQNGANAILIKNQKWHFRKQISAMAPSTIVIAYDCSK